MCRHVVLLTLKSGSLGVEIIIENCALELINEMTGLLVLFANCWCFKHLLELLTWHLLDDDRFAWKELYECCNELYAGLLVVRWTVALDLVTWHAHLLWLFEWHARLIYCLLLTWRIGNTLVWWWFLVRLFYEHAYLMLVRFALAWTHTLDWSKEGFRILLKMHPREMINSMFK